MFGQLSILNIQEHEHIRRLYAGRRGKSDSRTLIKFLRARKFNIEKAADLYKAYHEKREVLFGFNRLTQVDTYHDEIETLARDWGHYIAVLDECDTQGRRVIICKESVFKERF